MKFIDLFAGLGGFHMAMERLGHRCVFASELDNQLCEIYEKNFGVSPSGDIRTISPKDIPSHDILCAGFPCQPFSKAGSQEGLDCPRQGDLFWNVAKILAYHKPSFFILENVPNLLYHDAGETFKLMKAKLNSLGYVVDEKRFSPHHFGIPQVRERLYIIGSRHGLEYFKWPEAQPSKMDIRKSLDKNPKNAIPISKKIADCLEVWNRFIKEFPRDIELPGFPIWSMEFGATYPFENTTPYSIGNRRLAEYRGCHGESLSSLSPGERFMTIPAYAQTEEEEFPEWKKDFIRKNRELYKQNKRWIDKWMPSIAEFPPSYQKLEWNCRGEERDIWKYIIQLRASGIRIKRPTTSPSLVAMTTSQVPIVGWESRYMTTSECARLQSLDSLRFLPSTPTRIFKALGNAVNSKVVEIIARPLLRIKNSSSVLRNGAHYYERMA